MKTAFRQSAFLIVLIFLSAVSHLSVSGQKIELSEKKVLFLGNSITYQGNYLNDIEAYLATRNPSNKYFFLNLGLPSETVSGLSEPEHANGKFPRPDLHERLSRILADIKPDIVFACYGMNDGIYLPFEESRFEKFRSGIQWLHDTISSIGAKIIHITPSYYDERRGESPGYEQTLSQYSKWLLRQRSDQHWEVIDVHTPMANYVDAHRKLDAKLRLDGFDLAPDGIHPQRAGHWIMAKYILLYLGIKDVKGIASIEDALKDVQDGKQILQVITDRQTILRDAWLTQTGHKRPGLAKGLPMKEAVEKEKELHQKLFYLLAQDQQN